MRSRRFFAEVESLNFDISISDLMSALCGIFALVMITIVVQLDIEKAEYTSKNAKAESYYSMQQKLYQDLLEEFENDLEKWNAEITKDLTIRFKDSNVLFEPWSANLKTEFKAILTDFFPRLIHILEQEYFKTEIEEIRIEGHTAREQRKNFNQDYKEGMELSQERTREVMLHCLDTLSTQRRTWVQENIAAIGYSLSRPVKVNSKINWEASRRVEIKIKTKAEKVIEEIADMEFKINYE